MSKYYRVDDLNVRVSDHEPNTRLNGTSDINLYVKSADNRTLSIEGQIECFCERNNYPISAFAEVINEWEDGTYDKNVFAKKEEDEEEVAINSSYRAMIDSIAASNDDKLKGHFLSKSAKHAEIKSLSELTGVSQSYIKKHFNLR